MENVQTAENQKQLLIRLLQKCSLQSLWKIVGLDMERKQKSLPVIS